MEQRSREISQMERDDYRLSHLICGIWIKKIHKEIHENGKETTWGEEDDWWELEEKNDKGE